MTEFEDKIIKEMKELNGRLKSINESIMCVASGLFDEDGEVPLLSEINGMIEEIPGALQSVSDTIHDCSKNTDEDYFKGIPEEEI